MIIKEGESAVEPAKAIIKTLTDKYPLAFKGFQSKML